MQPDDLILQRRLDALEERLNLERSWEKLQGALELKKLAIDDKTWEQIWSPFLNDMRVQSARQVGRINALREQLGTLADLAGDEATQREGELWKEYAAIIEASQDIFRTSVEFIGGVAFREKLVDENVCTVADQLVSDSSAAMGLSGILTVPAQREARTRTLGRIIRVRFPEWSVWTLPFAAHEFGHVLLQQNESLKQIRDELLGGQRDPEDAAYGAAANEMHLEEFLADSFATYALGPSYAFAGIMLRFDPSRSDREDQPSDAKRAFVSLAMLRLMNKGARMGDPSFDGVLSYVETGWTAGVEQARRLGALSDADEQPLQALVAEIERRFAIELIGVRYGLADWAIADHWKSQWLLNLDAGAPLDAPEGPYVRASLANVLNAAWLCRMETERAGRPREETNERVNRAGDEALRICQIVVDERRGLRRSSRQGRQSQAKVRPAEAGRTG
jgi:hypothetical protein